MYKNNNFRYKLNININTFDGFTLHFRIYRYSLYVGIPYKNKHFCKPINAIMTDKSQLSNICQIKMTEDNL